MTADEVVASVIATEVPPFPMGPFTADMIVPAILAVAKVIRNRAADLRFPHTPLEVVTEPHQFSAVRLDDPKKTWVKALAGIWEPSHLVECLALWQHGHDVPELNSALWYYSPVSMVPVDSLPRWASARTEIPYPAITSEYFRFYKD